MCKVLRTHIVSARSMFASVIIVSHGILMLLFLF